MDWLVVIITLGTLYIDGVTWLLIVVATLIIIGVVVSRIKDYINRVRAEHAADLLIEKPWRARQNIPDDPNDRPDGRQFASWDEAYNRPITDNLRFRIEYEDMSGTVTFREITPIMIHLMSQDPTCYIEAHCHLQHDQRTFRSDRILSTQNLQTGRSIKDLGQYLRSRY